MNDFKQRILEQPIFRTYVDAIGLAGAMQAVEDMFNENLHFISNGKWGSGKARQKVPEATEYTFANEKEVNTFLGAMNTYLDIELIWIPKSKQYLSELRGKFLAGELGEQLNHVDEHGNRPNMKPDAELVADVAVPEDLRDKKSFMYVVASMKEGTDISAYVENFRRLTAPAGAFPLGANDQVLRPIWSAANPDLCPWRGWNGNAAQNKFASSAAGTQLLNDVFAELSAMKMPERGDKEWYDVALYAFGAIAHTQAFTDGNKRMARFAYAVILESGGVEFRAPTDKFGSVLAHM